MNKMKLYIIVESSFDVEILKKTLPQNILDSAKIISANGHSASISKAKSLAVMSDNKIILAVDSDSSSTFETEEKKEGLFSDN